MFHYIKSKLSFQALPLPQSSSFLVAIFLALLFLLSSCKIRPDHEDRTPPSIHWGVLDRETMEATSYPGNGEHPIEFGRDYLITLCIEDEGGVKKLILSREENAICLSDSPNGVGGGSQTSSETDESLLGLDENGNAWQKYCKFLTYKKGSHCPQGFSLSGNTIITCKAENFGGSTTTAKLSLIFPE